MKIIHIIRRFSFKDWGGAEESCLNLAKAQQAKGHEVEILTTKALEPEEESSLEGITIKRFKYFYPYISLRKDIKSKFDHKGGNPISFQMYKYLRKNEYDVIHVHNIGYMTSLCSLISKIKNRPIFLTLHGGHLDVPVKEQNYFRDLYAKSINYGKILDIFFKISNKAFDLDGVFCVGKGEYQKVTKQGMNAMYIPNGVNEIGTKSFNKHKILKKYNIPSGKKIVLNVARIDSQKNQEVLVKSLTNLKYKNVHLVIVGAVTDVEYHKKLLRLVNDIQVSDNVTIIPGIEKGSDDLHELYNACDVFSLVSVHEPFGIAVLEAWTHQKPVIASRVGGLVDLIEDGKTGVFFEDHSEKSLSEKIYQIIENDEYAEQLSKNGFLKSKKEFSWSSVSDEVVSFYKNTMSLNLR